WFSKLPYEAERFEEAEDVVGHIDLPPHDDAKRRQHEHRWSRARSLRRSNRRRQWWWWRLQTPVGLDEGPFGPCVLLHDWAFAEDAGRRRMGFACLARLIAPLRIRRSVFRSRSMRYLEPASSSFAVGSNTWWPRSRGT